ncbi:hypothetical protein Godav_014098 [Gossypium davidsonii]|uniref:Uncharacterized protein n=1 Tax=Gossypium davidsonii TaxID=34287 RepID=A0A7J8RIS6_GOSDV|nr:hypothetical protein [Gossypium davidsonii]
MDVKKHALSNQLSPKRKVFSRLGWGLAVSLIAITGLMLNSSFNGPLVGSLFQGYYGVNDTTVSLHFSSFSSVSNATVDTQNTLDVDNGSSVIAKKQECWEESEGGQVDLKDGVDIDIEGTQLENSYYEGSKTGNFDVVEGRIQQIAQHANGSVVSKNGDGVILEKTQLGNFSKTLNSATLTGKNVNANIVVDNPGGANNVTNLSKNGEVVRHFVAEKKDYNCSVDFVASPFLVKESSFKRENGSIETLRLDLMNP